MGNYNRVLVAVDGSETSLHALQEAFKLVGNWITVVAVAPPYEGDLRLVGVSGVESVLREPCHTALARAQELADAAGAFIKPLCVVGEPHEAIVAQAEADRGDLIVMGAKGLGFLERLLLGSVTRRVIGYSHTDVLVVPAGTTLGWQKILLATDGSLHSQAAASRALELAQAHGSELKVLSVVELPSTFEGQSLEMAPAYRSIHQGYVDAVTTQAAPLNLKAGGAVREGKPYAVITAVAREQQVDLIVMGSHGHTDLRRLLMGTVTERVIGHAPCPVLVVKGKEWEKT